MFRFRAAAHSLFVALALLALPSAANAADDFKKFTAFLVDLPGFNAQKAEGMSMEMSGQKMVTAQRSYEKGDKQLDASIVWGLGAAAQYGQLANQQVMRVETEDGFMVTEAKDGFVVTTQYTKEDKSGAVIVVLDNGLILAVNFQGMPFEEGQALAKKFDWKAIKAAAK